MNWGTGFRSFTYLGRAVRRARIFELHGLILDGGVAEWVLPSLLLPVEEFAWFAVHSKVITQAAVNESDYE